MVFGKINGDRAGLLLLWEGHALPLAAIHVPLHVLYVLLHVLHVLSMLLHACAAACAANYQSVH